MAKAQKTAEELAKEQEKKAAKAAEKAAKLKAEQDKAAENAAQNQSDAALATVTKNTAKMVRESEYVVAFIQPRNDRDLVGEVILNGVFYHYPKGKLTKIPKTIEDIVRQSEKMLDENDAIVQQLIVQQQLQG